MNIELNHLIVFAHDKLKSATFLTEILGLPPPQPAGNFLSVELSNRVTLDYAEPRIDFPGQHYAFLVSEAQFDASLSRIRALGVEFAADPLWQRPGEINTNDGGRGVYFRDPSGHGLELITRPYGSGAV
ncbi:VOC family protein [Sorangium sp. So ce1036]|uniref:VOC family protein n=1 Tax=Sorangium sp. So ce1036 TaxID=3133328 RepID=UPI003F002752